MKKKNTNIRFIRVRGRVIPIKRKEQKQLRNSKRTILGGAAIGYGGAIGAVVQHGKAVSKFKTGLHASALAVMQHRKGAKAQANITANFAKKNIREQAKHFKNYKSFKKASVLGVGLYVAGIAGADSVLRKIKKRAGKKK